MILDIYLISVVLGLISILIFRIYDEVEEDDWEYPYMVVLISLFPIANIASFIFAIYVIFYESNHIQKIGLILNKKIKF